MPRIVSGLVLMAAACSRARVTDSPVILPPPSTIVEVGRIASGAVAGYVTGDGGRPLSDAAALLDNKIGARTDSIGGFHFEGLAPGAHVLRIRGIGFNAAYQPFTLRADSGAAFAVRMTPALMQLMEVCLPGVEHSIGVRVHDFRGTTIDVVHGDSAEHFALDTLHDSPDSSGMRTVNAFTELSGRFYVTVAVPGYRAWQTNVFVARDGGCHVRRQLVTALLRR